MNKSNSGQQDYELVRGANKVIAFCNDIQVVLKDRNSLRPDTPRLTRPFKMVAYLPNGEEWELYGPPDCKEVTQ